MTLRNKVYAHTDVESGRSIRELTIALEGDIAHVGHIEEWHALDRALLDPVRQLCDDQAARLRLDGTRIAVALSKATEATEAAPSSE